MSWFYRLFNILTPICCANANVQKNGSVLYCTVLYCTVPAGDINAVSDLSRYISLCYREDLQQSESFFLFFKIAEESVKTSTFRGHVFKPQKPLHDFCDYKRKSICLVVFSPSLSVLLYC